MTVCNSESYLCYKEKAGNLLDMATPQVMMKPVPALHIVLTSA